MKFYTFIIVLALLTAPLFALTPASSNSASVGSKASDIAPSAVGSASGGNYNSESTTGANEGSRSSGSGAGQITSCSSNSDRACLAAQEQEVSIFKSETGVDPCILPFASAINYCAKQKVADPCASVMTRADASACAGKKANDISGSKKLSFTAKQTTPLSSTSCVLVPNPINVPVATSTQVSAMCFSVEGSRDCPVLTWSASIGSVSPVPGGNDNVLYSSGSIVGAGTVAASGIGSDGLVFLCSSQVTVSAGNPSSVSVFPAFATLAIGQTQQFTAKIYDLYGNEIDPTTFRRIDWTSASIGTVSQNGSFLAQSAGTGVVNATVTSGISITGSAQVTVLSNNSTSGSSLRCAIAPPQATVPVTQQQVFTVSCFSADGSDIPCPEMGWRSDIGAIISDNSTAPPRGIFAAPAVVSSGFVYAYANAASSKLFCNASVNIVAGNVASMQVLPTLSSIYVGQSQQFIAVGYDSAGNSLGNLTNVSWSLGIPIGTIGAGGLFSANSGTGNSTVTATYIGANTSKKITANATIIVLSAPVTPPNGGSGGSSGGSGSGGGAYRTSALLQVSCAGRSMPVTVTYYDSSAPSATAEIFYLAPEGTQKVFSRTISTTTVMQFTPEKAGDYELRVSLGTDQTNANFRVPECSAQTINTTQNITVNLSPSRELVLQRRAVYDGGFTKEFRVYRISLGSNVDYETEVDLYYTNGQNSALSNLTIQDSLPTSIVSRAGQVTFSPYPSSVESGADIAFEWSGKSVDSGKQLLFSYSFGRQLSEQMINGLAAPRAVFAQETIRGTVSGTSETEGGLFASLFGVFGGGISLANLLFILFALVLLFLIYTFVFGKKSE